MIFNPSVMIIGFANLLSYPGEIPKKNDVNYKRYIHELGFKTRTL